MHTSARFFRICGFQGASMAFAMHPFFVNALGRSFNSGGRLLSRAVSSAVPSAVCVLTVVFGMGTGVSRIRIAARTFRYLVRLSAALIPGQ